MNLMRYTPNKFSALVSIVTHTNYYLGFPVDIVDIERYARNELRNAFGTASFIADMIESLREGIFRRIISNYFLTDDAWMLMIHFPKYHVRKLNEFERRIYLAGFTDLAELIYLYKDDIYGRTQQFYEEHDNEIIIFDVSVFTQQSQPNIWPQIIETHLRTTMENGSAAIFKNIIDFLVSRDANWLILYTYWVKVILNLSDDYSDTVNYIDWPV